MARRPVANHDAAAVRVANAMPSHATAGICARRHDDCAWNDNDRSAAVRAASISAVAMKAGTAATRCQCRRAKFLIQPPVADDVLDIVRHHGEHKSDELGAETRVAHRRKGPPRGWRRADGGRFRIAHRKPSMLRSVRATSGSMMHWVCSKWICSNGFRIRRLSFARPSCRWSIAGRNPARAAARRGDYCLGVIKEQTKPLVRES